LTPTQRSLKYLRAAGYTVAIVEHWNPFARIRQDLFGFGDLMAIRDKPLSEILIVQTTSAGNLSARMRKISALDAAAAWLRVGGMIHAHGWRVTRRAGKRTETTLRQSRAVLAGDRVTWVESSSPEKEKRPARSGAGRLPGRDSSGAG
jgi:transposase